MVREGERVHTSHLRLAIAFLIGESLLLHQWERLIYL